ncbi:MAG: M48 family metallopeptidase [Proteobacteria bacterium]|nr:M48 family metallopeptidase [Pseudomonadota bacterium]
MGGIPMQFVRRNIRNLRIGVYAPHGEVRVAAPLRLDERTVRNFVISRFGWIVRKRAELERRHQGRQRQFTSGETHYYRGHALALVVAEAPGATQVEVTGDGLLKMSVPPGLDGAARAEVLAIWYRRQLRAELTTLVTQWEPRLGIEVAEIRVRQMKTRWGSCNARARRIWLNLDLIKRPPRCLEYVVVHELVHFFERRHNRRFHGFMDELLPDWRDCRRELNRFSVID